MDTTGFFHGNVADQLMGRYLSLPGLSAASPELGWMAAQVDAVFDEMEASPEGILKWKHKDHRAQQLEFTRECVTRLEDLLVTFCLPFSWQAHWRFEVPVKVMYGSEARQVLLVGETDLLVFDREGRVICWDLKATKNNDYWRKVLGQLSMYAWAVRLSKSPQLGRWPARCGLLQPMCDQRWLPVDVMADNGQAVREMAGRIERVARDIWEGRVPPKPGEFCHNCEVRHACSYWSATSGGKSLLVA